MVDEPRMDEYKRDGFGMFGEVKGSEKWMNGNEMNW